MCGSARSSPPPARPSASRNSAPLASTARARSVDEYFVEPAISLYSLWVGRRAHAVATRRWVGDHQELDIGAGSVEDLVWHAGRHLDGLKWADDLLFLVD